MSEIDGAEAVILLEVGRAADAVTGNWVSKGSAIQRKATTYLQRSDQRAPTALAARQCSYWEAHVFDLGESVVEAGE